MAEDCEDHNFVLDVDDWVLSCDTLEGMLATKADALLDRDLSEYVDSTLVIGAKDVDAWEEVRIMLDALLDINEVRDEVAVGRNVESEVEVLAVSEAVGPEALELEPKRL